MLALAPLLLVPQAAQPAGEYLIPPEKRTPGVLHSWMSPHGYVVHILPPRIDKDTKVVAFLHQTISLDPAAPHREPLQWFVGFKGMAASENAILVMPLLSEYEFAAQTQRPTSIFSLAGRNVPLDIHLNRTVDTYAQIHDAWDKRIYLVGFQAGAEAISRYLLFHPGKVRHSLIMGAGNYFWPSSDRRWPDGYEPTLWSNIEWERMSGYGPAVRRTYEYRIQPEQVRDSAKSSIDVVVGDENGRLWEQPGALPANSFPSRAVAWLNAMQDHAAQWNFKSPIKVTIVSKSNNGHNQVSPTGRRLLSEAMKKPAQ